MKAHAQLNETPENPTENPQDTAKRHVASDAIRTVTSGTFNTLVLEGEGPMAVEFMSYGCEHCRAIEPVLQQVAVKVKSKENIFRVNVAIEQELAGSYGIQGTPTFVMFLNGREVGRDEGPHPTVSSVMKVVTQPFEI
jgi:thioredoxin-like negative regulator of GroEL